MGAFWGIVAGSVIAGILAGGALTYIKYKVFRDVAPVRAVLSGNVRKLWFFLKILRISPYGERFAYGKVYKWAYPRLKYKYAHVAAAELNRIDMLKLLLDHKVDPNFAEDKKNTALKAACRNNNRKMVSLLFDHGASMYENPGKYSLFKTDEDKYKHGDRTILDFARENAAEMVPFLEREFQKRGFNDKLREKAAEAEKKRQEERAREQAEKYEEIRGREAARKRIAEALNIAVLVGYEREAFSHEIDDVTERGLLRPDCEIVLTTRIGKGEIDPSEGSVAWSKHMKKIGRYGLADSTRARDIKPLSYGGAPFWLVQLV
ncbi:MAG: hypothetical protein GF409_08200 [Candidatus Omnitrophica bacterium]|nr:hypothetical protein [Candidatus Omnitrophota bacterium]